MAKKPYGHTSYTRRTKSGKVVQVQAKGVKATEAKAPAKKKAAPKKVPVKRTRVVNAELLKEQYGIDVEGTSPVTIASAVDALRGLDKVMVLDKKHACKVVATDIYEGWNAVYRTEANEIHIDNKTGHFSFNHEFGHLLDYKGLVDPRKVDATKEKLKNVIGDVSVGQDLTNSIYRMSVEVYGALETIQNAVQAREHAAKLKNIKWASQEQHDAADRVLDIIEPFLEEHKNIVEWNEAVDQTEQMKRLRMFSEYQNTAKRRNISITEASKHVQYLREPTEVFARFFSQWCAIRLHEKGENPANYKAYDPKLRDNPFEYHEPSDVQKLRPLFEKMIGQDMIKSLEKALGLQTLTKSHSSFALTALTGMGKVKPIGEGKFGARQVTFGNGLKACLKPALHSNARFRGIPENTQHLREVAASQLDYQLLHFDVIQPAVLTMYKGQQASIALWCSGKYAKDIIPHVFNRRMEGWKEKVALFAAKIDPKHLRKVVLFDLIVNNTDRHAKNCLFSPITGKVWAIDHGLTFGRNFKYYYNVFHRFLFRHNLRLTEEERRRLEAITREQLQKALQRYLKPRDIENTYQRIQWMLVQEDLGFVALAGEKEGKDEFPSYEGWFKQRMDPKPQGKIVAHIERMGAPAPLVVA